MKVKKKVILKLEESGRMRSWKNQKTMKRICTNEVEKEMIWKRW